MRHLGLLSHDDPFYVFLKNHIFPQIGSTPEHPHYSVDELRGSNQVFLYREKGSHHAVIAKFFYGHFERAYDVAAKYLTKEWESLEAFRRLGFDQRPFYVPRPLGRSYDINCVIAIEYCPGTPFSDILHAGIQGRSGKLFRKLSLLAACLARLHNHSAKPGEKVDFNFDRHYGVMLVSHLLKRHLLSHHEAEKFYSLIAEWACKEVMWQDNQVLLHGDATPANFLFQGHTDIVMLDLEKSHYGDRLFDVGRIAGEIKHAFLQEKNDPFAAEPFIGHFIWQYCCHFPDCAAAFAAITRRLPFYLAITLLRIARNSWVNDHHRKKLYDQAFLNFHYAG